MKDYIEERAIDIANYIIEHYDEAQGKAEMALQYVRGMYDVYVTARRYLENYTK